MALVVLQAALGRREGAPKAVPAVELWHLSGTPTSLKVGGCPRGVLEAAATGDCN